MDAILNIDKPYGWSSTDVVRKVKPMLRRAGHDKAKVGHAGTLDPLATGVLLVCVGKATKRVEELQGQPKEYVFTLEFGATTVSYDLEHPVNERFEWEHITREAVEQAVAAMVGAQQQVPPLYSAKRIDGKRAYEYARGGEQVELRTADIEIYSAEVLDFAPPLLTLRVECSKGTYVRSIARDLGVELGSGAHLTALRRTRNGGFSAADGMTLEQAEQYLCSPQSLAEKE